MMQAQEHPLEKYLRVDRLPHVWCPGCGIGTVLGSYVRAIDRLGLDLDKMAMVSGIGCAGRAAGYVNMDSFHTTHGRAIPFAVGLKLAKPELIVTVFSGDGDLFAIGGNHFIHAARRNCDLKVICVNNFNYGMTGGQLGPTTPLGAKTTTSPYGNLELPLNLPYFAASCGSSYVARWTSLHARNMIECFEEILEKKGFCFVEILSPCPTVYGRRNEMPEGLDMMKLFKERCEIRNFEDTSRVSLNQEKIIIGKFVDEEEKETFEDRVYSLMEEVKWGGSR